MYLRATTLLIQERPEGLTPRQATPFIGRSPRNPHILKGEPSWLPFWYVASPAPLEHDSNRCLILASWDLPIRAGNRPQSVVRGNRLPGPYRHRGIWRGEDWMV